MIVKMHAKVVKIRAKIKQAKTNRQTIKPAKLSLTRQGVS
jgi:hypothetical protein